MTLTLHKSQVHCSGVMQWRACISLHSLACRGRLQNFRAVCSSIGLYCVTIIWQQILKARLQVTVVGVLLHVTVERRQNIMAGNSVRQWLLIAKPHSFILG